MNYSHFLYLKVIVFSKISVILCVFVFLPSIHLMQFDLASAYTIPIELIFLRFPYCQVQLSFSGSWVSDLSEITLSSVSFFSVTLTSDGQWPLFFDCPTSAYSLIISWVYCQCVSLFLCIFLGLSYQYKCFLNDYHDCGKI